MAAIQKEFDGELWFFSKDGTPKVDEVLHDEHVLLAYSEPKGQNYVSIAGRGEIVRDKAKIKELWSEPVRTWFPKGVDDPAICLIKVTIETRGILGRAVVHLAARLRLRQGAAHGRAAEGRGRQQGRQFLGRGGLV